MASVVGSKVLVPVHYLYSQSGREWGRYFNYWERLAVEGLSGSYRARSVVRDDDLCFVSRVIYLHTVSGEACCYRSQSFADFVKKLVWRVSEYCDCEIVGKKGGDGELV